MEGGPEVRTHLLDTLEQQAIKEAEATARRVKLVTGLDLLAHGKPLAEYVERRLARGDRAVLIATDVGYRDPSRVARVLAKSGHAPLGRRLLDQALFDSVVLS
jgi:hypothetical protein